MEIVFIISERQLAKSNSIFSHNCELASRLQSVLEPGGQMGISWAPPSDFHN